MNNLTKWYNQCMLDIQIANKKLSILYKKGIILTGSSKAGKTTLLYHLLGEQLISKNFIDKLVLQPKQVKDQVLIDHDPRSVTKLPNIYQGSQKGCYIVDLPGLQDKETYMRITNSYYIMKAMNGFQKLNFLFVVNYDDIYHMVNQFQSNFYAFLKIFSVDLINEIKNYITLYVSNSEAFNQKNLQNLIDHLQGFVMQDKNMEQISKTVLTAIISKKKIRFFQRPTIINQKILNKNIFSQLNRQQNYWNVKKQNINYHALTEQETVKMATQFNIYSFDQYEKFSKLIADAILQVFQKRNETKKNYKFIKDWKNYIQNYRQYKYPLKEKKPAVKKQYFSIEKNYIQLLTESEKIQGAKFTQENANQFMNKIIQSIKQCGQLNQEQLILCDKMNHILARKAVQLKFLNFLLKQKSSPNLRNIKDYLIGITQYDLNNMITSIKIDQKQINFQYYLNIYQLLINQKIKQLKLIEIIEKQIQCLIKMGQLSKQNSFQIIQYYIKALECIKIIKNQKKQQITTERQVKISIKIADNLYLQNFYRQAIDFYKMGNRITQIKKCVNKLIPNFSLFIKLGDFFLNSLSLQDAAIMYQSAFDYAEKDQQKKLAWKKKVSLMKKENIDKLIERFEKKIQKNDFYETSEIDYPQLLKQIKYNIKMRQNQKKNDIKLTKNNLIQQLKKLEIQITTLEEI